ncbi:MAG: cell division protein FtsK, partial [Sphingobacteriia bacterium]|nr:cell division protein FtsK [Sphingobacteriia bacterium]
MAQATRYGHLTFSDYAERALREGAMWALIVVALYLLLALLTYSPNDPGWSFVGDTTEVINAAGRAGAWFADVTLFLLGFFAYLIPLMVGWSAWLVFRGRGQEDVEPRTWILALRWLGFLLIITAGCGFAAVHLGTLSVHLPNGPGGGLGLLVGSRMLDAFNWGGANLLLGGMLLAGVSLFSGVSILKLVDHLGDAALQASALLMGLARARLAARRPASAPGLPETLPKALNLIDPPAGEPDAGEAGAAVPEPDARPPRPFTGVPQGVLAAMHEPTPAPAEDAREPESSAPQAEQPWHPPIPASAVAVADPRPRAIAQASGEITLPSLALLDQPRPSGRGYSDAQIEALSRQVE